MLQVLFLLAFAAHALGQTEPPKQNRIVGGNQANSQSWPWQASLRVQVGTCYNHVCGGVLIRKQWVLTSAQCVDGLAVSLVVLGDYDLSVPENPREQYYGVGAIFLHPSWNRSLAYGNDIALIRLSSEVVLNSNVQLATLPTAGQILPGGITCYATGWGVTQTGGFYSARLKEAYLPVVDYATCSSSTYWGTTVKTNMICAGGGSNAACTGDAGGPLNCVSGSIYVVHGLTSFVSSAGCNTLNKPTVFTRVSNYQTWIQSLAG
ncbi:elastase-1-like [Brachyhypopomus gauderio]|uniref:elastase-1-like n=1 Tax=Brachyhypopomus gauderio TaxID=698409 RepID=UPI0040420813